MLSNRLFQGNKNSMQRRIHCRNHSAPRFDYTTGFAMYAASSSTSLTLALVLMFFARDANCSVLRVSSLNIVAGVTHAISAVRVLPAFDHSSRSISNEFVASSSVI